MIKVRKNERSWAIEMISQINQIADKYDLAIKRAGGESTISYGSGKSMFPDVILYADKELSSILQGWELKMPDVLITDDVFVHDAQRKARALGLNSCLIWNFTYAKFYVYNESTNLFDVIKQWENLQIQKRDDVSLYRNDWEKTLLDVVITVNDYLVNNNVRKISIGDLISKSAINILINNNKDKVASFYKEQCVSNSLIEAELDTWWNEIKLEYQFDETDKYKAYAKSVVLNWAYRIIFAHLIKNRQLSAALVNDIDYNTSPSEANDIFVKITEKCDFYNVFDGVSWNELIPDDTWADLVDLSLFLKENGIRSVDQSMLQSILEGTINTTRRELNGQFTTDKVLARILACITIQNWHGDCCDPCCGTGTIPHEIILFKKTKVGVEEAIETTWASDKYKLPLQIANISMTSYDTINLANRLFRSNALDLQSGNIIEIVNPKDGCTMSLSLPSFDYICSNLPFVAFENITDDDKTFTESIRSKYNLDGKSDLSYYITLHLSNILNENGCLGIITSNSWLGTTTGDNFYHALLEEYFIKQVHISGKGKWFSNADIVTTILVLQKKTSSLTDVTNFIVWNKSLSEIKDDPEIEKTIINSSLLNRSLDDSILKMSSYTCNEIDCLHRYNLSYNSLFHDVKWLLEIVDKLIPINSFFNVIRGSRRGWDPLFFPSEKNNIEKDFIRPALFNAKKVNKLLAVPDRDAFCCGDSLEYLKSNYPGAYEWIEKFSTQKNGKNKPLPKVLSRAKHKWYEMKPNEVVEIFTMMNPDTRLFFGRFNNPSFINQRLIGLKLIDPQNDIILLHALLNSILMKFFIEAVGFGRGLGVLDINKDSISRCFILNPSLLNQESIDSIKTAFNVILSKEIMSVEEELEDSDWISFNMTILKAFNIDSYYDLISKSLKSLISVRSSVRN